MPAAETMRVVVIRTDGSEEEHVLPAAEYWKWITSLIGAAVVDTVSIYRHKAACERFRMRMPVMVIDDHGYDVEVVQHARAHVVEIENRPVRALKPVNPKATALYHAICRPGTTHEIVGDVAILDDEDVNAGD
jgi:hypothetical protein